MNTAKSIYLSPSTQEKNIGVGEYGTEEKRMNEICFITEKILIQHNIVVYRNKPEMTLQEVVKDSNSKKPNIHFAIHSNSGGGVGCEVFCHKLGGEGEKLARFIYQQIESLTPWADRGIKQGHNFYGVGKSIYELAKTKAPAALIEIDFHDNQESANFILKNIQIIGVRIAIGILNYFGIAYKNTEEKVKKESKTVYRVMTGSYANRKNAEERVEELKKKGFGSVIMISKGEV